ncbi:CHY zinc finger protein [Cryobacterium sp. CG_9.6]|uniref:CHY zinc finger protein n=1 Tax=Cryobacterium sp. CG_9.6 TaxID=2760710 RepID=UPI002475CF3C|nr:CHY zinc finger protein [Cryobacterium sp. CG_9.6]MDH6235746.1 putative CHY-type Zn-finger protein [Cryobacterium sp. CG_9.6]
MISPPHIYGAVVDDQTRCVHYHSPLDVIAIRFACCQRYYPCFQCHGESESHPATLWPESDWDHLAVICGVCDSEMSIRSYRSVTHCPACAARFNDGCRLHAHLYFAVPTSEREAEPQP